MRTRLQGDILLVPVDKVPKGMTEIPRDEQGRIVLAEGEATGHLHMIEAPEAVFLAKDVADLEKRFLEITEEVELTHPEHDTVMLEPGAYEVRRQREYTQAGGIELVAD
jgi:hypothetical protein